MAVCPCVCVGVHACGHGAGEGAGPTGVCGHAAQVLGPAVQINKECVQTGVRTCLHAWHVREEWGGVQRVSPKCSVLGLKHPLGSVSW